MPLKWSGSGMCIGGYSGTDDAWIASSKLDINEMAAAGFTKIRLGNTDIAFTNATARAKQVVLYALAKHLDVMWGPDQGTTITSTNWVTYHDTVITRFNDAMNYGLTRFSIGNEMESSVDGTTMTITQLFDNILTLATELQALKLAYGSSIQITYNSTAGATVANLWGGKSIVFGPSGSFDYLCAQPYGGGQTDLAGFLADCKRFWDFFGTNCKISEYNLVTDSGGLTISQTRQEEELNKRINIMRGLGFDEAYFYRWKDDTNSGKLTLKFVSDATYRQYYWSIVGGRRWFVQV